MTQVSGVEVRFTGDTRDLEKSVKRAESVVSSFAKNALAGLAGALTVGAFVRAGQAALNFADDIGKTAQKVGMTTEALSKLTYAAKLSDVSMQELQIGVQQLSKNMEAGSEGLKALGISATDSSGNLRSTAEVFADVAEAFSKMEDGAGKTAIAMNIFGRSGSNLIPLLNSGKRGLNEMGDEAQRLGVVISEKTAKSAEQFNDNLTRLNVAMGGLVQNVVGPLLPTLIKISEALVTLAQKTNTSNTAIDTFGRFLTEAAVRAATTYKEFYALAQIAGVLTENLSNPTSPGGALERWQTAFENIKTQADETRKTIETLRNEGFSANPGDAASLLGSIDNFGQKTTAPSLGGGGGSKDTQDMRVPGVAGVDAVDAFFIERLQAIQDGFKTEREMLMEEYAASQDVLRGALENQLLTEEEYRRLSEKLEQEHQANLNAIRMEAMNVQLSAAADVFGSLARLMEGGNKKMMKMAKAFGIAQVVINTAQGISKAFAQFGWPAGIGPAAAVAASGAAQLASIANAESGKIKGSGGGSGKSSGAGASDGAGGRGGSGPTTTFQFTLMNDPMGFGEKFARQFIDQLNSTQRNGGQIRGVIA